MATVSENPAAWALSGPSMHRSSVALLALSAAVVWDAVPASAQSAGHAPTPRWVEACGQLDDDTRARYRAVDHAMGARASLAEIEGALEALRATPCMSLAALGDDSDATPFPSAEVARAWWDEGGRAWAWQFLAYGSGARSELVLAPTRRPTLTLERAAPDDPLRSLLCPEADATCGRETAGWALRAERAFEDHARREREVHDAGSLAEETDCVAEALAAGPEARYVTFRACEAMRRPTRSTLPVGRMRAPTRGWVLVRGRRGHYQFRDEVRAYDLATGAAYVVSSGSALALRESGAVDGAATDAARRETREAGRLDVGAVRELAWMLLLGDRVEERHAGVAIVPLPEGVALRGDADAGVGFGVGASAWFSSAQTTLEWSWIDHGRVLHRGTLTWPESSDAAQDHAAALLRIAEATLLEGCAPAPLPALPHLSRAGGVSAIDAEPGAHAVTEDILLERLAAMRAPRCR